jgi:hypothetical protein
MIKRRGTIGNSRLPGIDPQVNYELSRLKRVIASITFGDQFPSQTLVGDMHYYIGEDTTEFKKNNWYNVNHEGEWKSMSGASIEGSAIRGTIPSGVTVEDYLSLAGGIMTGEITFTKDQVFPAEQIEGTLPASVVVDGYLARLGGQMLGRIDMTNNDIIRIGNLKGANNEAIIDMSTAGAISITAATLVLSGALSLLGSIGISGILSADHIAEYTAAHNVVFDNDVQLSTLGDGMLKTAGGSGKVEVADGFVYDSNYKAYLVS